MRKKVYDLAVIGGGPAGMAAAISAKKAGINKIIVIEQQDFLGGVLPQCIHDGFGLHIFGRNMTGPEYAAFFRQKLSEMKIEYQLSTTVMSFNGQKEIVCVGKNLGAAVIHAGAIVLAMGCKEKTRGMLRIPGTRPAGIYSAGAAQHMINIQNYLPGKSIVILGLGDIGLIMARRLTLEGAKVKLVLGLEANGLQRNMVQCIHDFNIPLKIGYTVTHIHGIKRLKGVTIESQSGEQNLREYIPCNTLLIAAGLIPESSITEESGIKLDPRNGGILVDKGGQTSVEGIFACGNVVEVHDLVDFVTNEGERIGSAAASYLKQMKAEGLQDVLLNPENPEMGMVYAKPEPKGNPDLPEDTEGTKYRICVVCPKGCVLKGEFSKENWMISGEGCKRGLQYGLQEMIQPLRTLTTTVKVKGNNKVLLPVKSLEPIPMSAISDTMKACRRIRLEGPVSPGDVVLSNVAGTGIDIVACDSLEQ